MIRVASPHIMRAIHPDHGKPPGTRRSAAVTTCAACCPDPRPPSPPARRAARTPGRRHRPRGVLPGPPAAGHRPRASAVAGVAVALLELAPGTAWARGVAPDLGVVGVAGRGGHITLLGLTARVLAGRGVVQAAAPLRPVEAAGREGGGDGRAGWRLGLAGTGLARRARVRPG